MENRLDFWLHRVLEEKTRNIKELAERISILNHQIKYYDKMAEVFQEDVKKDLVWDLMHYNWQDAIKEIEDESKDGK